MLIGARFHKITDSQQIPKFLEFDFLNLNGQTHYMLSLHDVVERFINQGGLIRFNNITNPDNYHFLNQNQIQQALESPVKLMVNALRWGVNPFTVNVFNETLLDTGDFRYSAMNLDSYRVGFEYVKSCLPGAKLGLSDYRLFLRSKAKFDAYFKLIEALNQDSPLVESFSIQIWRYVNDLPMKRVMFLKDLGVIIQRFQNLGIEVHISECAVFVNQYRDFEYIPSLKIRIKEQASYYQEIMDVCKENGAKSFCFWQPFDSYQAPMIAFQKRCSLDYAGIYDSEYNLKVGDLF